MDSIRGFPEIRFLWRWEGELPQDIPDNLYLSPWFKQQDILGKCFVVFSYFMSDMLTNNRARMSHLFARRTYLTRLCVLTSQVIQSVKDL